MPALIVYESLFGATHALAEEIASGLREHMPTTVGSVHDLDPEHLPESELVILGAPTHTHGLSTPVSRENASLIHLDSASGLRLEHEQNPIGMAEWLPRARLPENVRFAVFDTRIRGPRLLVGSAAHHLSRLLEASGRRLTVPPESFYVMDNHRLEPGERERAREWGAAFAAPKPEPSVAPAADQPGTTPASAATIVVGHDGSAPADRALETALELAAALSAPVLVVRTWAIDTAPPGALFHDGYASSFTEVSARVRDLLIGETRHLRDRHPGVEVEHRGILGQAAETLISVSRDARMLVVGSRGRGGFASLMLGSVSEQCVRHATCPVLVVRPSGRELDHQRS